MDSLPWVTALGQPGSGTVKPSALEGTSVLEGQD